VDIHAIVYIGLALVYCEAALHSLTERKRHCACREIIIALLYAWLALVVFLGSFNPGQFGMSLIA
jgi:hypothetical protein